MRRLLWQEPPNNAAGDWMGMGSAGQEVPPPGGPAQAPPGGAAQGGAADELEDDDEELLAMQRDSAWVRPALPPCRPGQRTGLVACAALERST